MWMVHWRPTTMTRKEQIYPLMGNHVFTFRKKSSLIRLSSYVQNYTVTGCDSTRIAETSDNNLKCLNIWKYTYNHSKKMRKLPQSILIFTKNAPTTHNRHCWKVNILNSLNIDFLRLFWDRGVFTLFTWLYCQFSYNFKLPRVLFFKYDFYFYTNTLIEECKNFNLLTVYTQY